MGRSKIIGWKCKTNDGLHRKKLQNTNNTRTKQEKEIANYF